MENKLDNAFNEFLSGDEKANATKTKPVDKKKVIIQQDFSLVEHVNKVLITQDGRQLLCE